MTMESSLLLAIIWSPLEEKSRQLTRSVFSLNTFATRKERKTSSVSFIATSARGASCLDAHARISAESCPRVYIYAEYFSRVKPKILTGPTQMRWKFKMATSGIGIEFIGEFLTPFLFQMCRNSANKKRASLRSCFSRHRV